MSDLLTIPRGEFIEQRFRYKTGQHVTFLGRTQSGKTTLAYDLLSQVATVKRPAVSLVMKPRDKTVTHWSKQLGHKIVRTWPPMSTFKWFPQKPPGYILWPRHTFVAEIDDSHLETQFRKAIQESYKRGSRILFADEVLGLTHELGLKRPTVALWTRGSSTGVGLWAASQRPFDVPLYAYNQASHLFLAAESDKRNRDRFSEIGGGFDSDLIKNEVLKLKPYQWLYVGTEPRAICIVDAQ